MTVFRAVFCVALVSLLAACGSSQTCEKPQPYEAARPGPKISAPEGLDDLQADGQIEIPEASRENTRAPGDPCLDFPPVLRTASSDDEDEEDE